MRIPRIYQAEFLAVNQVVQLDVQASGHLLRVLRLTMGAAVIVFNGQGGEYSGRLSAIKSKIATISLEKFHDREVESPLDIHLAQAVSRGERMDFVMQKSVELGVAQITPVITEHSTVIPKKSWNKKQQHWQEIAIHACQQCGRNRLPTINKPQLLAEWVQHNNQGAKFILHQTAAQPLSKQQLTVQQAMLLIGPEGGFSKDEIEFAEQHGFTSASIGPRMLRTETAALAAITLLQSIAGDF